MKYLTLLLILISSIGLSTLKEPNYENEYFVVLQSTPSFKINLLQQNKKELQILAESVEALGGKVLTKYLYAFVGLHIKLERKNIISLSQKNIKFISKNAIAYPNETKSGA